MGKKIKSQEQKSNQNRQQAWLMMSVIGTVIVCIGYILIPVLVPGATGTVNIQRGAVAGLMALIGVIVTILVLIACIKVKRWAKLVPILCLPLCLLFTFLAYFAYSFSGYGSSY